MDKGVDSKYQRSYSHLFNSPLEGGIRAAVLLDAFSPSAADLQRLVYLDYLLVHSGDVPNGPKSLHPAVPHRSGELLVRRDLIAKGLALMQSKELVAKHYDKKGINFSATELLRPFLDHFSSEYMKELRYNATWIAQNFNHLSDGELDLYFKEHLDRWGGEFIRESVLHGGDRE